eukprot:8810380-Pyramimonas_sp.AAC.1
MVCVNQRKHNFLAGLFLAGALFWLAGFTLHHQYLPKIPKRGDGHKDMTFADDGEAADAGVTHGSTSQTIWSTNRSTQPSKPVGIGLDRDRVTLKEVESLLAEGNKIFSSSSVKGLVKAETAEYKAQAALRSKAGFQPLLKAGGKKKLTDDTFRALEAGIHVLKDMEMEGSRPPPVA